jgi:hypothetical protein
VKEIMKDIGDNGRADDPDLRNFFSEIARAATEALM